ncbi:MAG: hypothetical protein M1821_006228 [Bathelium mastoideum]|nr:MAG: hypothetical protein M1821_006228 [Bathelium mastoideum]
MFSPETSLLGAQRASTRNPRRRQRHESESLKQDPAPRRKRSRLSSDTFLPPSGHAAQPRSSLDANGHIGSEMNGSSKLLHLHEYNYSILSGTRYALGITRTNAYVWDYTAAPGATKPRVFDLQTTISTTEPLPVGTLLASRSANELGIVIVTATGKILFWENVETLESSSLFQQKRNSATAFIGGMLSGEKVWNIVSAEHAGFVVVFSTGRLAHLTLRDAQGKPQITAQFLRNQTGNQNSGFLGGLKSVFGAGSWRADLAAVRTCPSDAKSNMNVIAATLQGEFHIWEIDWSAQQEYKGFANARDAIETALKDDAQAKAQNHGFTKIIDFVFYDNTNQGHLEVVNQDGVRGFSILALVEQPGNGGLSTYALADIALMGSSVHVNRLVYCESPMKSLQQSGPQSWPRLRLPRPDHTAVLVFEFAVALVSIKARENTPESQLLMEARVQVPSHQDTVPITKDDKARLVGYCEEPLTGKNQESEFALITRHAGVLRFSVSGSGPKRSSDKSSYQLKSRIEQAIFYGDVPGTLIDFNHISANDYALSQVEKAAQAVSHKILTSRVDLIQTKQSMAEQLDERARLLHNLALYLKQVFPPLSRNTKWSLLWDAEKLKCARAVWSLFEVRLAQKGAGHRTNLEVAVACMDDSHTVALNLGLGETDELRTWFTKGTDHFDKIIECVYRAIKQDYGQGNKNALSVLDMAREADDIAVTALNTAWEFRSANLALYGLEHDALDQKTSDPNFSGMSEIWTSNQDLVVTLDRLIHYSRMVVLKCDGELEFPLTKNGIESSDHDRELLSVAARNPALIRVTSKAKTERLKWLNAEGNNQAGRSDSDSEEKLGQWQTQQIRALQQIELWDDAIRLADEFNNMQLLVDAIKEESEMHSPYLNAPPKLLNQSGLGVDDVMEHEERMTKLVGYIREKFVKHGWAFAQPYYQGVIDRGTLGGFIDEAQANETDATRFLREHEERFAKLGWINEVLRKGQSVEAGRKNLSRAGDMLNNWVSHNEKNLWSAKVEASMAKLAYMAENGKVAITNVQRHALVPKFEAVDSQAKLLKIQERVYAHVAPVLEKALDATAKIELTMAEFARRVIKLGRKGHARVLQACFEKLLRLERLIPTELIELLTLMDTRKCEYREHDISGQECGLALEVLQLAGLQAEETLERGYLELVWKRALVRDDWKTVNATQGKSDREVNKSLAKTETCGAFKTVTLSKSSATLQPETAEDCLGAGTDLGKVEYAPADKRLAEQWAEDNDMDDDVMSKSLKHHRLGYWFERSKALALEVLENETVPDEAEAEDIKQGLALLQQIEDPSTEPKEINNYAVVNGIDDVNGVEDEDEDTMDREDTDEHNAVEEREENPAYNRPPNSIPATEYYRNPDKQNATEPEDLRVEVKPQEGPVIDLTADDEDEAEPPEDEYMDEEGNEEPYDEQNNAMESEDYEEGEEYTEDEEGVYDEGYEDNGEAEYQEGYEDNGGAEYGVEYEDTGAAEYGEEYGVDEEAAHTQDEEDVVMEG